MQQVPAEYADSSPFLQWSKDCLCMWDVWSVCSCVLSACVNCQVVDWWSCGSQEESRKWNSEESLFTIRIPAVRRQKPCYLNYLSLNFEMAVCWKTVKMLKSTELNGKTFQQQHFITYTFFIINEIFNCITLVLFGENDFRNDLVLNLNPAYMTLLGQSIILCNMKLWKYRNIILLIELLSSEFLAIIFFLHFHLIVLCVICFSCEYLLNLRLCSLFQVQAAERPGAGCQRAHRSGHAQPSFL